MPQSTSSNTHSITWSSCSGRHALTAIGRYCRFLHAENAFAGTVEGCAVQPDPKRRDGLPQIDGHGIEGTGAKRTYMAEAEWTFPLEFAELVWGDGDSVHKEVVPATDMAPFGRKVFRIPFDATGKKWVRFALWDSAGNGAFTQPVHLK